MPGMGGPEAGGAPAGGGGAGAAAGALGPITVNFNGETNTFSRDCVLTYSDNNNIAFTLHNMKVTRIHIWKSGG
jgi:predicted NBD/HSP70 family sugar kinase